MEHLEWLQQLDMLPVSELVYGKQLINAPANASFADWQLYDIYKIAPQYPLAVSTLGRVFGETPTPDYEREHWSPLDYMKVQPSFYNKSSRDDLQGLKLKCGLVVRCVP